MTRGKDDCRTMLRVELMQTLWGDVIGEWTTGMTGTEDCNAKETKQRKASVYNEGNG